jgi:ferrous iron transport protein B
LAPDEKKTIRVALAGNPNSGKTTIFNAFTGARQHVGNYPGVTVEKKEGTREYNGYRLEIVDLPGTYSLTAYSLDEVVARNFLIEERPDVVVDIIDSSNLERNLYLATQLMELEIPVILCLNMSDVAKVKGLRLDEVLFSQLVGAPVVFTVGNRKEGIDKLLDVIVRVAERRGQSGESKVRYGKEIEEELEKIELLIKEDSRLTDRTSTRYLSVKLLENDEEEMKRIEDSRVRDRLKDQLQRSREHLEGILGEEVEGRIADHRYGFIHGVLKEASHQVGAHGVDLTEKVDQVLTHRLLGLPIFAGLMWLVFKLTFTLADKPMEWIETATGWLGSGVGALLPEGMLSSLIVDGVIGGVGGVIVFLPNILLLFIAIAVLEDSGYMARAAFLMDRIMHRLGLHGKSFIPMLIGFGCTVPAYMGSRTLENRRDRLLTMHVNTFMSCGARLPVYVLICGAFWPRNAGNVIFSIYLLGIVIAIVMAKLLATWRFRGPSAPFVMELPPYHIPTVKGVLIHMWERGWLYLRKAGTIILAVSIIMWALMTFPRLGEYSKDYEGLAAQAETDYQTQLAALGAELGWEGDLSDHPVIADLETMNEFFEAAVEGLDEESKEYQALEKKQDEELSLISSRHPEEYRIYERSVEAEVTFQEAIAGLENKQAGEELAYSAGGRIGRAFEYVTKPLGFDWRLGIGIFAGFAAKEVVVATLGTVYSMGETDEESEDLRSLLRDDPVYTPLVAYAFMVFILLYFPCMAAMAVFYRETGSMKETLFQMAYTTALAYVAAFVVYQGGRLLGLG